LPGSCREETNVSKIPRTDPRAKHIAADIEVDREGRPGGQK
jgi:hypothetical protein